MNLNLTPESLPAALDLHRLPTLFPLTNVSPTITLDIQDVLKRESRVVPTFCGLARLSPNLC